VITVTCPRCDTTEIIGQLGVDRSAFFQAVEAAKGGKIRVACGMCDHQFEVSVSAE
jgi:hypothetical protein